MCSADICYPDGRTFEGDSRNILKRSIDDLNEMGYYCEVGTECSFYLFTQDEYGNPSKTPHDQGTYYDVAPVDKGENIRREICLTLEEMGYSAPAFPSRGGSRSARNYFYARQPR